MLNEKFKQISDHYYEKNNFEYMCQIIIKLPPEYTPLQTLVRVQWNTMILENIKVEINKYWTE